MDSASPTLLSRARQGQPLAIAMLIQQRLDCRDIDVMAWKKADRLQVELMSFDRLVKADMLSSIRATLAEAAPEGVRATKISNYIYGEETPCWIERMAVAAAPALSTVGDNSNSLIQTFQSLGEQLKARLDAITASRQHRRLAVGAALSLALVGTALSISAGTNLLMPSFANQQEADKPVRMRSQGQRDDQQAK